MTPPPDSPTSSARRRRRWPWIVLAACLLPIVVAVLLIVYRVEVAERTAILWLRSLGVDHPSVTIDSIGLTGIRLRELDLGRPGPSAAAAEIEYSLRSLLDGRLGAVKLSGLTATATIEDDGLQIEGLPLSTSDDSGRGGLPGLPFDRVVLEDFSIALETPLGLTELAGNATVRLQPDGSIDFLADMVASGEPGSLAVEATGGASERSDRTIQVLADIEGAAEARQVSTQFTGALELTSDPSGRFAGRLTFEDAELSHSGAGASGVAGAIGFAVVAGELAEVDADMRLSSGRVGETGIDPSSLKLAYDQGLFAAAANMRWAGGELQAELRPAGGNVPLPYALKVDGVLDAAWIASLVQDLEASGDLGLALSGEIVDPVAALSSGTLDPAGLLTLGEFDGQIALDLGTTAMREIATAERIKGPVELQLRKQVLHVRVPPETVAEGVTLAPGIVDRLPAAAATLLGEPLALRFGEAKPAELTVSPAGPGAVGEIRLEPVISVSGARLVLDLLAHARIAEDFALRDEAIERLAVTASKVSIGGMTADGSGVVTNLAVTSQATRGEIEIDLTIDGAPAPDVQIRQGALQTHGSFELTTDRLTFLPSDEARVRLGRIDAGPVRTDGPVTLTIRSGKDDEPIVADFSNGFTTSLRAGPIDLRLIVTQADPVPIRASIRSIGLNVERGAYTATLSGGRLVAPDQELTLDGLAAKGTLDPEGRLTLRLDAAEVKHLAAPPWVVPLRLAANVQGTLRRATVSGELFETSRRLVAKVRGNHSFTAGTGKALVTVEPITFIPTVLHPRQLFPASYRIDGELDARLSAEAGAEWGPDGFRSSGTIEAEVTELSTAEVEIRELATTLRFDSLFPPSTLPRQLVTLGEMNVGLPLTDGVIRLELHPDQRVTGFIDQLQLFGGSIRTEPFEFDPEAPATEVRLQVEGVDLAQFLAFTEFGEVEATGTLRGTIPIVFSKGEVSVRSAMLETAEEGGILRYRPSGVTEALEVANEATETLMRAVQNFEYSKVRAFIDESSAEEMTLRLELEGRSPDVYEGFPLQLNVNVSGPLRDILNRGIRTYQLPAALGREMQERAQ